MKIVDLFCGIGGLSLGFGFAGHHVLAGYDFWDKALENYNANVDHPGINFDLSDVENAVKSVKQFDCDMIIGGPPCQDYSSAGKRVENTKANLTISFAEIISKLRPKTFVMENVDRAASSATYRIARSIFKNAGYGLTEQVLDASLCGVPQKRKRFFCIGKINSIDGFLDRELSNGLSATSLTVREYMGSEVTFEHYYRHPRSYTRRGIFSIDEPSPTIRGVNRPVPKGYVRHPGDTEDPSRVAALTLVQRARIQTFPATFKWTGTKTDQEQMIGNAVPVELARYVAEAIDRYE